MTKYINFDLFQVFMLGFIIWLVGSDRVDWWLPLLIYGPHLNIYFKWEWES